jgi:hypothetical protein
MDNFEEVVGMRLASRRGGANALLFVGQAIADELRDALRGGRIHVREHRNRVARLGADIEVAVHAGGATAVAEAANCAAHLLAETVGVLVAAWRIDFAGGEKFGVVRVEQLVGFEGVGESKQIPDR